MGRDELVLKLGDKDKAWSSRLISILNHLNKKMPTGMTLDDKSLSVNLLNNCYLQGYTLHQIAQALGIKTV